MPTWSTCCSTTCRTTPIRSSATRRRCALAYDQIHLTEREKIRLYDGLIRALSDSKLDVRSIAALALSIQTGQTKGFDANADAARRDASVREWRKWLDDYRSRW